MKPWENTAIAPNGIAVKENFTQWFSDSKLKNKDGTPMVFYHGTGEGGFTEFSRNMLRTSYGFFFTDDEHAAQYYTHGNAPQVIAVYLHAKNPLRLDTIVEDGYGIPNSLQKWISEEFDSQSDFMDWLGRCDLYSHGMGRLQDSLMAHAEDLGYDAVVFFDAKGGGGVAKSFVVFEAHQIKSATENSGNYDRFNPSLTDDMPKPSFGL